jgi:hypothetical protein
VMKTGLFPIIGTTESHASALDFVIATRAGERMGIMRQGLDSSIGGPVLPGKIAGGRRTLFRRVDLPRKTSTSNWFR